MIQVTLYTRQDCHLCQDTLLDLKQLESEYPHRLVVIDIDSQERLQKQYGLDIPVVEIGPYVLKAPISLQELRLTLAAASEMEKQAPANPTYRTSKRWTRSDSITLWFSKHYLAVINLIFALYVGLPFLAPVLMQAGAQAPAALIYRVYGGVCHQLSYRSFFLFGEQIVYPRQAANIADAITFGEATGLSEGNDIEDVFAARIFVGNPAMGYKVALCQRDVAIYGAVLFFGLLYALTGRRIKPLAWYWWVLFGLMPVAVDGLSQLLSQPPFNFIDYRESTPFLRFLSGALFGFFTAWFGIPMIDETMRDTQRMMEDKLNRVELEKKAQVQPALTD